MSNTTLHIFKLEFGSLLSYSPIVDSEAEQRARDVMLSLKRDTPVSNPSRFIPETISNQIKANLTTLPFSEFFSSNPTLVPLPKSSRMRSGDLWVPRRIANALFRIGLGNEVAEYLIRDQALPKSAFSTSAERPTVAQHYNSLGVQKRLPEPKEILLIDDVITRGATILGAANRLADVFPQAQIRAFAAMRAMSRPFRFNKLVDPCKGEIMFDGQNIRRRP